MLIRYNPSVSLNKARARAEKIGLKLRYDADPALLAAAGAPFTQLGLDEHTAEYLLASEQFRHGTFTTWIHRLMRGFWSDFDINGILGTYPMHVLSRAQWETLFDTARASADQSSLLAHNDEFGRLLDIGAGRGDATEELAPLFAQVTVTETSKHMARRLRSMGFECLAEDISSRADLRAQFDVVSLLNVLDRCDRPMSLLATARQAVKPGGLLLIALVLPYKPFVYDNGQPRAPEERLAIRSAQFEVAAAEFVTHCLLPLGLTPLTLSRAPYLSGGDAHAALYELDDLIVVCQVESNIVIVGENIDEKKTET